MYPSEAAVETALRDPSLNLWRTAWTEIARHEVARAIANRVDFKDCMLSSDWDRLDTPGFLQGLITNDARLQRACSERVLGITWPGASGSIITSLECINAEVKKQGHKPQKRNLLRKRIAQCASKLIADPISTAAFHGLLGRDLWTSVAHCLAADTYHANKADPYEEEWLLLNRLLLAEWFLGCRFEKASHVRVSVERLRKPILQVRGYLVRIPDYVCSSGVIDEQPTLSTFSGPLKLAASAQFDIASAIQSESANVRTGSGFVYQILNKSIVGMRECAELYEYSILAYMALSCTEQLLRCRAQRLGVAHLKPNGVPDGVIDWIASLGLSQTVENQVSQLFDSRGTNIRNRIMHGGMLDHDAKWDETRAAMNGQSPKANWQSDPRLPKNICFHCFECLEAVDKELAAAGDLPTLDFSWTSGFLPNSDEIDFARKLRCDLFREESRHDAANGPEWIEFLSAYTDAVMPSMKQPLQLGVVGWLADPSHTSFTRFFALTLILEAAYRLTAHLLGFDTLQKSRDRAGTKIRFQTRMLDSVNGGICTDDIKNAIVAHARPEERDTAKQVLDIAIKTRNALTHGAFVKIDDKVMKGLGNVLFKSIQMLVSCGYAHMVGEAAYFRWQNDGENHGSDLTDWRTAQHDISKLIKSFA